MSRQRERRGNAPYDDGPRPPGPDDGAGGHPDPAEPLHPALLMFIAARHAEQRIMEHIRGTGFEDITVAQARLMARVDEGGSRLTSLAESAGVTKQTAHVLVEQLVKGGYLTRVSDPDDRRARLIQLSRRAVQVRAVAREAEAAVLAQWSAHLGAADLRQLTRLLTRLRQITDRHDSPSRGG